MNLINFILNIMLISKTALAWFEWSHTNEHTSSIKYDPQVNLQNTKFEIPRVNENLMLLSENFMNVSPMQACKYKIVTKLKAACSQLSDEDLSRMSIAMLNCQLELEGHDQFECDTTMSLSHCIKPMNETTWNIYQHLLISMKLSCQVLSQQLYQHQIENTVNKISLVSENYLVSLGKFKVEHEDLVQQSNQLKESSEKITQNVLEFSRHVKSDYEHLNESIKKLNDLLKSQNKLMDNTQKLNGQILKDFDTKLESLNHKIETLESILARINNHSIRHLDHKLDEFNMNFDLIQAVIVEKFEKNFSKILNLMEQSSLGILRNQEHANQRYQESLAHLDMLNSSVHYLKIAIHGYILKIDGSFVKIKKFTNDYGHLFIFGGAFSLFSVATYIISKFCLISMKNLMAIQIFSIAIMISVNYFCEKLDWSHLDVQEFIPFALISQFILIFFLRSYNKMNKAHRPTPSQTTSINKTPLRSPLKEASCVSRQQLQYGNASTRLRSYNDYGY